MVKNNKLTNFVEFLSGGFSMKIRVENNFFLANEIIHTINSSCL